MTLKAYYQWFQENWAKAGVVLGIFVAVYLVVIVLPQNLLLFVLMMYFPLYILHEADEYIFPGGFAQFVNRDIYKTDPQNGLVDPAAILWINMLVWFFLPLSGFQAITDLTQAAFLPYFVIFQAVVHLVIGIVGKRFFNPGMLTAWLVHVPWGIWTILLLMRAGVIVHPYWNSYLRDGLLINLALPVAGLILWIRYKRRQRRAG
ncbi:MAG TPA: HXXEE domain-containing protein [Anaerolineales bacterium]|nr:HXXEE domain-containing protein [Anaerolineales bacterium]